MLVFKRLSRLLEGNKLLYFIAVVSTAIAAMFSLLIPLVVKYTVDTVINGEPSSLPAFINSVIEKVGGVSFMSANLWICAVAVVVIAVIEGVFIYSRGRCSAVASENIARNLKNRLYDHLQKLPYDYHVKAQTGDLIQRCTSDVNTVRQFLATQVIEIGRALFVLIFSIIFMLALNVKLTLVSIIVVPFIVFFSVIFFTNITKRFLLADEKEGELSTVLQENLSGVRVVRAFGREKYEMDKFEEKNAEFRVLSYKMMQSLAFFWGFSDLLCLTQTFAIIMYGVYLTNMGEITLGTLMVFITYEGMLLGPIRNLGRLLSDFGKMSVSLERVNEVLTTPAESDTEGAICPDIDGDIVFDNVNFAYDKKSPVLKGLSFKVNKGETVAFLGSTGSGKSTLMHILLRLYDYDSGSIKINGVELRNIQKKHLREKVGIVLQEPFLYSRSIIENIKMARDEVTTDEIYKAARTASVHDVINKFEAGYNTKVGEKGVTLSGGQKQRVVITRTLIKNSDILIFDDSLSAVDAETDVQIRAALSENQKNTTTFIISQRITTLMNADRIYIIENGQISDSGKHEDLIERDGLYSRIWKIQNMIEGEFIEEDFAEEKLSEQGAR